MKSITVGALTKFFSNDKVIDNISFHAEEGQITSLLGPSGCGKTTTLRCIAGLETPASGHIAFGDETVFDSERGIDISVEKRKLGMIFQSYALWPHMTVQENVAYGLNVRDTNRMDIEKRVGKALDLVQLRSMAGSYPSNLSGGQQQRVALARCLAYDPEIILLDEPLANLDAKLRDSMRYELLEVQRRTGVTALYVTHDQLEAMSLSQKMIVMEAGKIAQEGVPEEVYREPANRFVADFIGNSNFLSIAGLDARSGYTDVRTALGVVRCPPATGACAWLMVRPEDIQLVENEAPSSANTYKGLVKSRIFHGDIVQLHVLAQGDTHLTIHVRNDVPHTDGARIRFFLPESKVRLLKA